MFPLRINASYKIKLSSATSSGEIEHLPLFRYEHCSRQMCFSSEKGIRFYYIQPEGAVDLGGQIPALVAERPWWSS